MSDQTRKALRARSDRPAAAPIRFNLIFSQINISHNFTHGDQGDVKIDYDQSQQDRIFGRFSRSRQDKSGTDSFPLFFDDFFRATTYPSVYNRARTFSPHLASTAKPSGG